VLRFVQASVEEFSVKNWTRRICLLLVFLVFCAAVSTTALAKERTTFGHDINVGPGEEIDEATCFGCTVHVRGHVNGDVTVFGGAIVVEDQGKIGGDVTIFGGGIRLDDKASISGDATVFGGRIRRESSSSIGGDITNFGGAAGLWIALITALPLAFLGGIVTLVFLLVRRMARPSLPAAA
jgi:hypothetical protein